jgi:hypothetical protein
MSTTAVESGRPSLEVAERAETFHGAERPEYASLASLHYGSNIRALTLSEPPAKRLAVRHERRTDVS